MWEKKVSNGRNGNFFNPTIILNAVVKNFVKREYYKKEKSIFTWKL